MDCAEGMEDGGAGEKEEGGGSLKEGGGCMGDIERGCGMDRRVLSGSAGAEGGQDRKQG